MSFLRRTRLYKQVVEICEARRELRIAEYRSALRLKRAAVRARVRHELLHAQLERMALQKEHAQVQARLAVLGQVLSARTERAILISNKLREKENEIGVDGKGVLERLQTNLEQNSGKTAAAKHAGVLMKDALEDSMKKAKSSDVVDVAAELVRELGLSEEDVRRMVKSMGDGKDEDSELGDMVIDAMTRTRRVEDEDGGKRRLDGEEDANGKEKEGGKGAEEDETEKNNLHVARQ